MRGFLRDGTEYAPNYAAFVRKGLNQLFKSTRISSLAERWGHNIDIPLCFRPWVLLIFVLDLLLMAFLGFHPSAQEYVHINDKVLHFFGFLITTFICFWIWSIDTSVHYTSFWNHAPLVLTLLLCIAFGCIGSEYIQSMLPSGDVIANLLGGSIGLFASYKLEQKYRNSAVNQLYEPLDLENPIESENQLPSD